MPTSLKLISRIEYLLISLFAWLFRRLPVGMARNFADGIALIASKVLKIRRDVALDNLKHAFPEKPDTELNSIYHSCWRHFLRLGAEMARLPRFNKNFMDKWITFEQENVIDSVLRQGKGAIIVSGHIGNWEWMGGGISILGYPISCVVTSQTNPLAEQWLDRMRMSTGIEIINRRDAVKGILKALKQNRVVAIMCDQDAGDAGIFVPFFNRPASTPRGPALFHLKTGAPIVYGFAPREKDNRIWVRFELAEFAGLTGMRSKDVEIIMREMTSRLEREVRSYPEQWLWLHRRWKTQPVSSTQD